MASHTDYQALLQRVQRIEDRNEIIQIMGRRAYYHSAGRHDLEINELWSSRDDIVFEAEDVGAWTSQATVRKAYIEGNPFPSGTPGLLIEHTITTPVIEIAADGQTAKGIWISPGHETFPVPGENPKPHWMWGKYAVDFVKEGSKWKIWHLHVLTTFRTPFDTDWVQTGLKKPEWLPKDGEGPTVSDRGVSFNEPYRHDRAPKLQPVPPEPYKKWEDTWSATDFYEITR